MKLLTVTNATHIRAYQLELTFSNGEVRLVDLKDRLDKPVFIPLKDIAYFKSFRLNPFTIEWENGADFAPEYLFKLADQKETV